MKMANMDDYFDVVIVGTGAAGLYCALNLPARYRILLLTKQKADESDSDVLPYFDFDMDKCREYVALRNPNARVIPICARTGEGIDEWADWLKEQVKAWQA